MNHSLDNKLQRSLMEIYVLLSEANHPESMILYEQAVRIAQRMDSAPPEWLSRAMLKAPGVSQFFIKQGKRDAVEDKRQREKRNKTAYFIAEAYDNNRAKKYKAKGYKKYEYINKVLREEYGLGAHEIDEESIRIEIFNFRKKLENGTEKLTSMDQIERAFLDDFFEPT